MAKRAKKNYKFDELIYSGYPYVVAVKTGSNRCEYCYKLSFELKRCMKCLFARYCQKSCQKEAWPDHKLECRFLKNFPENVEDPLLIRLISLLILKMKDKKWEDVYEYVDGEKVSFADMWSDFEEKTKSPKSLLHWKAISASLNKHLSPEMLPNQERLFQMIEKVASNAVFVPGDSEEDPDSLSLHLGIGNIHPSCIPNAHIHKADADFRKLIVTSTAEIRKKEKITVNKYNFIITLRLEKSDPNVGQCKCDDCLKPYGESVLSKILDDTVAYSVIIRTEDLLMRAKLFSALGSDPAFLKKVEDVLEQQEGVLGNTHFLRLRLLALKVFEMDDNLFSSIKAAEKLLEYAKEAFGEYHKEVVIIALFLHGLERKLNDTLHSILEVVERKARKMKG